MTIDEIIQEVGSWPDVVTLTAGPGDGTPELAWGDSFFSYTPDGQAAAQPFATIVTKDYPGDTSSRLDRPGAFRVNVHAGRAELERWQEQVPGDDVVTAHPVYARQGWLAVVNPATATDQPLRALLRNAYELDRARHERRERSSD